MPDEEKNNMEHLEETVGMEEKINQLEKERAEADTKTQDDCDQEEPMTRERAIHMMSKIFPIELGSRVRNKHCEDGVVEMVGVDFRGVLYLVSYKGHESSFENEHTIKQINDYGSDAKLSDVKEPAIKTDIPEANVF